MGPWAHPARRISRYIVVIAHRFHFDPRVIDEWTIVEFDQFAHQCDAMDAAEKKQERAMQQRSSGMRRR